MTRVEVELDPFAVEVSELTVEVERRRNARMRGIHRRAERRPGSVLLREEIEEVEAVEVYQSGTEPPEFMDMRGCGAVAIWLRQR